MSLTLLQTYSSDEDEPKPYPNPDETLSDDDRTSSSSLDEPTTESSKREERKTERSVFDHSTNSSNSLLPSAFDVFSEVGGPPEFLNSRVGEWEARGEGRERGGRWRGRGGKAGREKKDLPAGVIVEAKPQLSGIRDRVRSDIDGSGPTNSGLPGKTSGEKPRVISAANPEKPRVISAANPEPSDAADLLRMCIQCGVPKTYSHSKGMVCPLCSDRPPADPNGTQEKKKGSTIKDKEKSKRMKGQSSHAAWKSETEMQLRQQFD